MAKKRQVNKYIVRTYNSFTGPDGQDYTKVWGPVTTVKNGYKIGFKNDHVIIAKDEIQSRALCNTVPVPSPYTHREIEEGKLVEVDMPWDTYVCVESKNSKYKKVNELNQRLKK